MAAPKLPQGRPPGLLRMGKLVLFVGGGLALALAVFWWAGLPNLTIPFAAGKVSARALKPSYVGSSSCRECHPGESAHFSRSGHARILRPAAGTPLARKLNGRVVADPEEPSVYWAYALLGDEFGVTRSSSAGEVERFVIDYAFGSDHHATTFVSLAGSNRLPALEHRLTHYSSDDVFDVTPGQSAGKPYPGTTPRGRVLPDWEARACFRCHTTRISAARGDVLKTDEMIPNVSCERCHGPGSAHVASARAGAAELSMPFGPGRWTSETQMALCGKCHRHPSEALPGRLRPELPALARFQPIGIMQSKCYQSSAGGLSCVNCHDPHARASSDRASYEAACLHCHEAEPRIPCPVSPVSGCLACHMPRVDTGQRVYFTDHWIRVRTAGDPPSAPTSRSRP